MCLQSAGHKPQKVDAMSPPVCGWIVSVPRGPFNVLRLKESHNGNGSNECAVHMRSHFVVAENLQTKLSCARSPSKGVLFCVLFRSAPPKAGHVEFVAFAACWPTPVTALSSARGPRQNLCSRDGTDRIMCQDSVQSLRRSTLHRTKMHLFILICILSFVPAQNSAAHSEPSAYISQQQQQQVCEHDCRCAGHTFSRCSLNAANSSEHGNSGRVHSMLEISLKVK